MFNFSWGWMLKSRDLHCHRSPDPIGETKIRWQGNKIYEGRTKITEANHWQQVNQQSVTSLFLLPPMALVTIILLPFPFNIFKLISFSNSFLRIDLQFPRVHSQQRGAIGPRETHGNKVLHNAAMSMSNSLASSVGGVAIDHSHFHHAHDTTH